MPDINSSLVLITEELLREVDNHPERNDLGEEYANRELLFAAQMYLIGGRRKERGSHPSYVGDAAEDYPEKWGGDARGTELLAKLTPKECYVRACALILRHMRRLE